MVATGPWYPELGYAYILFNNEGFTNVSSSGSIKM